MRVISGIFKGKRLYSPEGNSIRPTSDRIKESVFNILNSRAELCGEVLDLFCGSGALGIEALSRGAKRVVFIDNTQQGINLVKTNLAHIGLKDFENNAYGIRAEVYNTHFKVALQKLSGQAFDFIFADPPYNAGYEKDIISLIFDYGILKKGGYLVLEHSIDNEIWQLLTGNVQFFTREMGNTAITFICENIE